MIDTLMEDEFLDFLEAAVTACGSVPEFSRRFDLDSSVVHKILKGHFRPRPALLSKLRVEEVRLYLLPDDAARWYARHISAAQGESTKNSGAP